MLTPEEQRRTALCNVLSDRNKERRKRVYCVLLLCDIVSAPEQRNGVHFCTFPQKCALRLSLSEFGGRVLLVSLY